MALMGFREYARHRQVTLRAVQKAIEAGRIKLTLERKIDSHQADKDWVEKTDPSKQSLLYSAGPTDTPPRAEAGMAAGPDAADDAASGSSDQAPDQVPDRAGDSVAYREHRANRERINAERAQIELDQMKGSLIDLEEAKRLAYTAFRTLRDAVLNVPTRIKDQCAAESDAFRVEQLIETELVAALNTFDLARVTREVDDDDPD